MQKDLLMKSLDKSLPGQKPGSNHGEKIMDKSYYIVKVRRDLNAFQLLKVIKAFDIKRAKITAAKEYLKELTAGIEITVLTKSTWRACFDRGMIVDENGTPLRIGKYL